MRLSIALSALAAVFVLTPVAVGYAPALCQDFSITNQVEPANPTRRDVMRQLQAWWDEHAYYPRHASNSDEGGTVKLHLVILPDGRVWTIDVVESSGSRALDSAADAVFRGASVRTFPQGESNQDIDLSLHYVLAFRHDQTVPAGYKPVPSRSPFTISNDPVGSPILDTMLQRICTGSIVLEGLPNKSWSGTRSWAQAIFFRKPDGTPWVKFWERGHLTVSPVTQVGKMLTWIGRLESARFPEWHEYTVWPDGDNHLSGSIGGHQGNKSGDAAMFNLAGNSVDLTCSTETLPSVTWNDWLAEKTVLPNYNYAPVDPP